MCVDDLLYDPNERIVMVVFAWKSIQWAKVSGQDRVFTNQSMKLQEDMRGFKASVSGGVGKPGEVLARAHSESPVANEKKMTFASLIGQQVTFFRDDVNTSSWIIGKIFPDPLIEGKFLIFLISFQSLLIQ
jgi:hypothetical protein